MILSMVILTFILIQTSRSRFKIQNRAHVIIYQLSLATVRGEGLLKFIPSVCLFTNVHGINNQYNLKSNYSFLVQVGTFWGTAGTVFSIAIPLESLNRFKALSKNQNLHWDECQPHLKETLSHSSWVIYFLNTLTTFRYITVQSARKLNEKLF